ncbi:MAG: hypothetical protein ABIJ47_01885 [Candidatus Bathyarchaeota archaeon]
MTLRRTKTQRRSRPRRERGKGGVGLPNRGRTQDKPSEWKESDVETLRELHAQRSYVAQKTDEHLIAPIAPSPSHWIKHPGEYDVYGVDYPGWKIKKQMEKRSDAAQATDRALKAPLAPTPEEWMKHPEMYDLPDVDTPQKTKAKPLRVDEQKNPMGTPNAAKDYLADVVETYRKRLGVKGDVKLRAQKGGYPARIIHSPDGKPSQIVVNYRHFGIMWERDPALTRRYLEYAVAHEMAHQKQIEEIGFRGALKADKEAKSEVEVDADHRAFKAMGVSEDAMGKVMDKLARAVNGEHVKKHAHYKGTPNLSRFKDLSPVEKPGHKKEPENPEPKKRSLAELRDKMVATYGKALAEILPGSTQHERELIAEKAVAEQWIDPDKDTSRTAMAKVTEKARAELVKIRQEKAAKDREEQLKALKERAGQAHAKKTDEQRLREQLALRREEYGVQYDAYLGGALSQWAANKRDSLYTALKNMGYSDEEAGQISHTFNGDAVGRIQAEALAKARKEAMDVADDAYGELTGLWNEAIQKNLTAEAAERHAKEAVEAAYNDALGGVRDRTEPHKLLASTKSTVKTSSESYDFYADPGHGWLRVPVKRLEELGIAGGISPYSYVKGDYAYLEEDSDARIFADTLEDLGVKLGLREHTANRESSIRKYQPYQSPAYLKAKRIILEAKSHAELEGIEKAIYKDPGISDDDKKQLSEYVRARAGNLPETRTPAVASPTEEARKRYDETVADRVPRMAKTARLDLRKALLGQGFTVEWAEKYMDRLTDEASQRAHADFFAKNRMYEGIMAERIIQRPEIEAERDALTVVQNEYEKLKKEALEEWAIARGKVTAISQSPEIKRIMEGYEAEHLPQQEAVAEAKPSVRQRVASMSFNEANALIRDSIKAACPTVSIRRGRGTAAGWLDISGSKDEYGNFTDAEKQQLATLGITASSNSHGMDFDDKVRFIERNKLLDEPAPKPKNEVVIDIPDKKPAATYDAETEKIIKKIMDHNEVSRVLVEKRIAEERDNKAGLITNEAAATFVAYQMLGEPEGKTPWAKISMNQMGGIYRIDEYSPTQNKVLVEHIGFKTREEAQAYVDRVNNPAGSEMLPSLKKATAFSPAYSKESGMYEVEVYNPETGRKSTRRFSTPDKAEQYRRLINENPGWPLEGFKERQGSNQGKPKYLIIARNVKSRGDEAIAYTIYDRDKSDRNNQNVVNRGTIEYKEAPGKDKIIEDLILEAPKGPSYAVEFTVTPHWTPALSEVERIAPSRPGDRNGKWMVWFKNRVGRDMNPREGMGTRSFDTHGEALDFAREGRGRYNQGDFEREAIWLTVPEPPTLPSELESFLGKQSKFLVDPRPRYEGTWDPDRKAMEYRWVWENQIGGQTHTLDELKEERQKGEWKTRDRVEAAKSSRTVTRKKGMSNKAWDHVAQPLTSAVIFPEGAIIEADDNTVTIGGMDGSHVAMMIMKLPNDLGIPEGKYEVADFNLDKRVTHLRHPKKLEWDNVERTLKVANENQDSYIRYEKVHEYQNRYPEPRITFQATAKLDMEALKKAVDGGPHIEHIALVTRRSREAYGDIFTYEATARENQKVTQVGDDGVPWESEELVDVPLTGSVGEVKHVTEDEVKTTYTTSYLSENLEKLMRAGFKDATLEFATDMPLKITAKRDDGAEAEFWLAPCIGV